MSTRKMRNRWYIDIRFNGKRLRKASPENTRTGARAYEAFVLQELSRGVDPFVKEKEKKILIFEEFSLRWVELYVKNNNKISGVRGKLSILNTHLIPFMGNKKLNEITSFLVEEYKASALKKGLCNKTVNCHITVLNTCLTHAVEWDELDAKPHIRRLKVPQQKFDFLTFEESEMLLDKADGQLKEMLLLALHTGMRYGEIRALNWADINWEKNILSVKKAFYRDILGTTKSNKERHIPLTPRLSEMLQKRRKKRGFIFADVNGKHLEENLARRALKRLIEKTELKRSNGRKIAWHALRHTFASQLAMRGAPLSAIQQLLGHSNIQTTMRYAHLSPSTLNETIMLLENHESENLGQHMGNSYMVRQEITRALSSLKLDSSSNIKQKQAPMDLSLKCGDGES